MTETHRHAHDSRASLFTDLRRLSPKVTGGLLRMREEAYRDGTVPAKHKLLAAMAVSIAIRCEPCVRAYARQAHEQGASEHELVEFLEVAMTMQGCPGEEWALTALKAYRSCSSGERSAQEPSCCET